MPSALTWDPTRAGGGQSDDGRSGTPPISANALVSGAGIGRVNVALVGDSLLASFLGTTGGSTVAAWNSHPYMQWAQRHSLGVLNVKRIYAVSGTRLADHILQAASVDATDTPVVFEDGGINDINLDSASVSYCVGKKLSLWAALKARGATVYSVSLLPLDSSGGGTLLKSQRIRAFNQEMQRQAPAYGVRWINIYDLGVDPTSANGYPKANYLYDGIHNSNSYGYLAGKAIWAAISGDTAFRQQYSLSSSPLDGYVAASEVPAWVTNPLMTGSGGSSGAGVTGTMPTGWFAGRGNGTPTAVASVVADPDGFGNALQLAMTFGASGDQILTQSSQIAAGIGLNDLVSGEVVCRITANAGGLREVCAYLLMDIGGSNTFVWGGNLATTQLTADLPADNVPILLSTPIAAANNLAGNGASMNSIRLFIAAQAGSSGSATILLSRSKGRKYVTY